MSNDDIQDRIRLDMIKGIGKKEKNDKEKDVPYDENPFVIATRNLMNIFSSLSWIVSFYVVWYIFIR